MFFGLGFQNQYIRYRFLQSAHITFFDILFNFVKIHFLIAIFFVYQFNRLCSTLDIS